MNFSGFFPEIHVELLIFRHLFLDRRSHDDPIVVIGGVWVVGVTHPVTEVVGVKGGSREEVATVSGRVHELVKGTFGSRFSGQDGFDLVGIFKCSPFDRQSVSRPGEMPIRAIAVGIDVSEVIPSCHVLRSGTGDRGEAGVVNERFSFLSGMSPHQSRHLAFPGGASVGGDRKRSDDDVVRPAAGIQSEATDEADEKEAQLDA